MKKRILCLFLGVVMILSTMLVSCSPKEEEAGADVAKDTSAKTITLSLITEKKVCNTDAELAEYLETVCGGDEESEAYQDMLKTKAAYDAVEKRISDITKKDKINVDILFYTEDEYKTKLEQSMEVYTYRQQMTKSAQKALKKYIQQYREWLTAEGYPANEYPDSVIEQSFYKYFPEYKDFKPTGDSAENAEDVYAENELGIPELVYPKTEEGQLDIVYVSGYDTYSSYIEKKWLTDISGQLDTVGQQLKYYVSPTLIEGVKVDGKLYGIPNNVSIGEYTYMLVDKQLADKYKYLYNSFGDLEGCRDLISDITKNEKGRLPIDATFEECMDLYTWYWNIDVDKNDGYGINSDNDFSVIGTYYGDPTGFSRGEVELGFNSLFADEAYRDMLLCLKGYEYSGAYKKAGDERTDPAISFVDGSYAMKREAFFNTDGKPKDAGASDYGVYTDENGKEYYLYVAKCPQVDEEALYGNMFCVSSTSQYVEASMKVINTINTNSQVRDLLQYGIKDGEHEIGKPANYTIDEETGVLRRLNDLYVMDIKKTGNCFIAHPEEGMAPDLWEDAKAQNNDALIYPLLGFDFNDRLDDYGLTLDDKLIKDCKALSKEVLAKINACETYAELEELVNVTLADALSQESVAVESTGATVNLAKLTNKAYSTSENSDKSGESPYTIYYNWLVAFGYDVK